MWHATQPNRPGCACRKVGYKSVDELSNVWCEYAEMEIRADEFDNALNLMKVRRTAQESRSALRNVQPCTAIQCETDKIRRSVADNCTRPTGKQNTQSHGIRCGADPTPPLRLLELLERMVASAL